MNKKPDHLKAIIGVLMIPALALVVFRPVLTPGHILFTTDDNIGALKNKHCGTDDDGWFWGWRALWRDPDPNEYYMRDEIAMLWVLRFMVPFMTIGFLSIPVLAIGAIYRDLAGIEPIYNHEEHANGVELPWWSIFVCFAGVIVAFWIFGSLAEWAMERWG